MIYQLAALGAALCWALSSFISVKPAKALGPVRFNKWRMTIVCAMLIAMSFVTGGWRTDLFDWWLIIALSAFTGIFMGDTLLFWGLKKLGPRRNSVLFSLNAPITVLLGWLFLDERLSSGALFGTMLISSGVLIAVAYGRGQKEQHVLEETQGSLIVAVLIALSAATCQAVGVILVRPAMEAGLDPTASSAVRVGIAALCLWTMAALSKRRHTEDKPPLTRQLVFQIAISGALGMGLGMTLLLYGLKGGDAGVISTLSSASPVLVLPILWYLTKKAPSPSAWIGAALVLVGSGVLFTVDI
ncbi:MAG: DMT family transporter [Pseudomonadales bacterium]